MEKKRLAPAVILIIAGIFAAWAYVSAPNDVWMCEDGQWVKYGDPTGAQPETICGSTSGTSVDGNDERWARITAAIADCRVVGIMQAHDLGVRVELKDGSREEAKEPALGDVMELWKRAKEKCGDDVIIAIE